MKQRVIFLFFLFSLLAVVFSFAGGVVTTSGGVPLDYLKSVFVEKIASQTMEGDLTVQKRIIASEAVFNLLTSTALLNQDIVASSVIAEYAVVTRNLEVIPGKISNLSLCFYDNTDTGIFSEVRDRINFVTGGVTRAYIEADAFNLSTMVIEGSGIGKPSIKVTSAIASLTDPVYSFNGDTKSGLCWASDGVLSICASSVPVIIASMTQLVFSVPALFSSYVQVPHLLVGSGSIDDYVALEVYRPGGGDNSIFSIKTADRSLLFQNRYDESWIDFASASIKLKDNGDVSISNNLNVTGLLNGCSVVASQAYVDVALAGLGSVSGNQYTFTTASSSIYLPLNGDVDFLSWASGTAVKFEIDVLAQASSTQTVFGAKLYGIAETFDNTLSLIATYSVNQYLNADRFDVTPQALSNQFRVVASGTAGSIWKVISTRYWSIP